MKKIAISQQASPKPGEPEGQEQLILKKDKRASPTLSFTWRGP
jgi:hypothetical protein